MSIYDLVMFVHVLSAVLLVGGCIVAIPAVDANRLVAVGEIVRALSRGDSTDEVVNSPCG